MQSGNFNAMRQAAPLILSSYLIIFIQQGLKDVPPNLSQNFSFGIDAANKNMAADLRYNKFPGSLSGFNPFNRKFCDLSQNFTLQTPSGFSRKDLRRKHGLG
jgi:hypothetical protein